MRAVVVALLALPCLPACDDPAGVGSTARAVDLWIPQRPTTAVDLLFVVDNSPSMTAGRAAAIVEEVAQAAGALVLPPSLHVGVVTADLGAGQAIGGCTAAGDDGMLTTAGCDGFTLPYLVSEPTRDGLRATNFTGELAARAACAAAMPTTTCVIEQPLEAARRAFDDRNPGFARAGAERMIVIISDEDDCSLGAGTHLSADELTEDGGLACARRGVTCTEGLDGAGDKHGCAATDAPATLADLGALRAAFDGAVVSVIAGPDAPFAVTADGALAPSCGSDATAARPALRLHAVTDGLPLGVTDSLCEAQPTGALATIASLDAFTRVTLGVPCVDAPLLDVDATQPGLQAECAVTEVVARGTTSETRTAIPACDAGATATPCWRLVTDQACTTGPEFRIERRGGFVAPDAVVHAQCAIE